MWEASLSQFDQSVGEGYRRSCRLRPKALLQSASLAVSKNQRPCDTPIYTGEGLNIRGPALA